MNGSILIAAAFVCCASGFALDRMYAKQYGDAAILLTAGMITFGFLWDR